MTIARFQKTILDWYETACPQERHNLPWRKTRDPYKILVSEIMLQQTQIPRVLKKYEEFLQAFPTLEDLANASDKKLLSVWQGMGYWRRAKYLKETARIILKNQRVGSRKKPFVFFEDPEQLEKLPGIGPYTARALACFAFGSRQAFLDTNIRRIYLHFFFSNKEQVSDKEILPLAQKAIDTLPKTVTPREWGYALFDYGAVALKDKSINKRSSHYAKQSKFEGSFRSYRTKVLNHLLSQKGNKDSRTSIKNLLSDSPYQAEQIIQSLLKDGIVKKRGDVLTL